MSMLMPERCDWWIFFVLTTKYVSFFRLLYLYIYNLKGCEPLKPIGEYERLTKTYCSQIWWEAKADYKFGFPRYFDDLLLEQSEYRFAQLSSITSIFIGFPFAYFNAAKLQFLINSL